MKRKQKTARCSRCGKKLRLLADGTIPEHDAKSMASKVRYMRRPDLDDYVETIWCPGRDREPHKGRWYGKIGWIR